MLDETKRKGALNPVTNTGAGGLPVGSPRVRKIRTVPSPPAGSKNLLVPDQQLEKSCLERLDHRASPARQKCRGKTCTLMVRFSGLCHPSQEPGTQLPWHSVSTLTRSLTREAILSYKKLTGRWLRRIFVYIAIGNRLSVPRKIWAVWFGKPMHGARLDGFSGLVKKVGVPVQVITEVSLYIHLSCP